MNEVLTLATQLRSLAFNLWWTWHTEVVELFRDLDPAAWRETNHNPIALLDRLSEQDLERRIDLLSLESRIHFHYRRLQEYLANQDDTWCAGQTGAIRVAPIAYFSAEFGLHESLPLYSGGLGVLAGDYLKSASDLGLPVVGVGLFYATGYFRQRIDETGWQREEYGTTDITTLPLRRAAAADGSALLIKVPCGNHTLHAGVWLADVGRTRLLLLDSEVMPNAPELRDLTARLYGGDELARIRQEILLGIGGLRALGAIGVRPRVLHLNEGHSAFVILERMRERMQDDGLTFDEALRETAIQTVFTTHTPVEAGHDRFDASLLEQHLGWLRQQLGIDAETFLALGRTDRSKTDEKFCMTVLAMKGSRRRNGVSSLHGHVARRMWRPVWPARLEEDVPIGHVTNGVHVRSWLAPGMARIYDRHCASDWMARETDRETWLPIARVDDGELWEAHAEHRRGLLAFVRRRVGTTDVLDPNALTIGFARRFATYKRATLVMSDP
ncbi:MAG: alpha-glucan family phosphorylase, partial [Acidobacteria bacterium]|nr:alpha-glucan family phosphorylase [Acidobacteriota bacterium]